MSTMRRHLDRSPSKGDEADPEQSRRFIKTARELGCDENEEALEQIFARIVRPRKPGEPPPPKVAPRKGAGRRKRTESGG